MKRTVFALCLCFIPLGGCATITALATGNSVASTAPAVSSTVEKSLTIAHLAYNAVGQQLINNAKSGVLHGSAAATAKIAYDKAGDAISVADKAEQASNEPGIIAAVNTATDAISQANSLITDK